MSELTRRLLSVLLVLCMVSAWILPAGALDSGIKVTQVSNDRVSAGLFGKDSVQLEADVPQYADTDVVRVSIFLDRAGVIDAGYAVDGLATNESAMAYRGQLQEQQLSLVERIENAIQEELDVVWNLTLATNLISANVKYGQIQVIEKISGVRQVIIETPYEPDVYSSGPADPNMATASSQIGTMPSYAAGYTGAGSRIAIIDTGLDTEHLSFGAAAYEYSLSLLAEKAGKTKEEYVAGLDLLDMDEISRVLGQLNVSDRMGIISADDLYINSKLPFGFNYLDLNMNVGHMKDNAGEHGSHVAGIAAANAYVSDGMGGFEKALEKVFVQGVAPDAQVFVMKVFGEGGGAYPADYMAAVEDAIVLGADSINLSLGSGNPGMTAVADENYRKIYDSLERSGVVLCSSAGNAGAWMDSAQHGIPNMYLDDVSMQTNGTPGSYTNVLAVASVDNAGFVTDYVSVIMVDGKGVLYYDDNAVSGGGSYSNKAWAKTLSGEYDFVLLNGYGKPEEFAALGENALKGKVALCYRGGGVSFFEKANAAVEAGAVGLVVINNVEEYLGMNLTGYKYTAPVVSIPLSRGEMFKVNPVTDDAGNVLAWTGKLEVPSDSCAGEYYGDYYTMSSFSSWGVPGSLELKPEITAPGGEILSVDGANRAYGNYKHDRYEVLSGTSMASPQVAGMAALVAQYIRENNLTGKTGLDARILSQSLLMSTAVPILDGNNGGYYYSVLQQGAGLGNVGAAIMADSYILMNADATASYADGKVKVELGDDPARTGKYSFSFTINNLTDETETFSLYADFFTQNAFVASDMLFLDTMTHPLSPIVTFTVNGQPLEGKNLPASYDFNGDGRINADDGQLLLDVATGLATMVDQKAADLNGDGKLSTYDAYLFFVELGHGGADVPAGGKVTVKVNITLSQNDIEWLANYENGAYLEGYVYAESAGTAEGVAGTVHSIPVLGFYGSWSDPSMYDKGTYNEYLSGTETRAPYLYEENFSNGYYNGVLVQYPGTSGKYWYGGNPVVKDSVYMPERDAISAVNGTMIAQVGFTAIRNAADSYFIIKNGDQLLKTLHSGQVNSAYYYVNGQEWRNTYYTLSPNVSLSGVANDAVIEVGMMLIPEYYMEADGSFKLSNVSSLGDGAFMTIPMVVDNLAPVLGQVDVNESTLDFTVTDNRYVAGVALYDLQGERVFVSAGSVEQSAGDTVSYSLDLSNVNGNGFLLQVYDYAMNVTTYELDVQIGEVVDRVDSVTLSATKLNMIAGHTQKLDAVVKPDNALNRNVIWSSSNEKVVKVEDGLVTAVGAGQAVITATAAGDASKSATCTITVREVNVTLHGVLQDAAGESRFFDWNMRTDSTWKGGLSLDTSLAAATMDTKNNKLYVMEAVKQSWRMHVINPATGVIEQTAANNTGIPLWDMAYSTVYSTAAVPSINAIYGTYLLPLRNPLALDTVAFNLKSKMSAQTGATYLVAIASAGYEQITYDGITYDTEHLMMLDDAGYIWNYWIIVDSEGISALSSIDSTNLSQYGLSFTGDGGSYMFTSMVVGEDGNLYLSTLNDETCELYQLSYNSSSKRYDALALGNVGADVWPAMITHVTSNGATTNAASFPEPTMMEKAQRVSTEEMTAETAQKSNTLLPLSSAVVDEEKKTMTVEITAQNEKGESIATTNGLITVTYDSAALALKNVVVNSDYVSIARANGAVTFAYVAVGGLKADEVLASLVFDVLNENAGSVTITHREVNDTFPNTDDNVGGSCNYVPTVTKTPTTQSEGTLELVCSQCGDKKIITLPALNTTDYTYEEILAPTDTADGLGRYTWKVTTYGTISFDVVIPHKVAQEDPQVVIQSVTTVAGSVIRLEVVLKNNPGVQGMSLLMSYDTSVLSLIGYSNGNLLSSLDVNSSLGRLQWSDDAQTEEDGVLCVLEFRVAEDASAGNYPISLTLEEAFNGQWQAVSLHMVAANVEIAELVYGDINGDGLVDLIDLLMLRTYLVNLDPYTGVSTLTVGPSADVNADGKLGVADVLLLRQYLVNRHPVTGESSVVLGPR